MDSSLDIAFRVADIKDRTFNQALSQVLGLDIDLIQKRVEQITTARELIMEQCTATDPPPPPVGQDPKCPVCHEYGDPFSEASKHAHTTFKEEDLAEELKGLSVAVKDCIRDNVQGNDEQMMVDN
jgi:hypothetical protein